MQTNKINNAECFNELKYNFNKLPIKLIVSLKQDLRNIKSISQSEHYDRLKLVDGQEFKIMKDLTRLLLIILTCNENSDDSIAYKDMKENKLSLYDMTGYYALLLQMKGMMTQKAYQYICIDEIQDLAGYDLEIIKLLFESSSSVLLVGDPRQVTYLTNHSQKHSDIILTAN